MAVHDGQLFFGAADRKSLLVEQMANG